jgi:hypothetical protein
LFDFSVREGCESISLEECKFFNIGDATLGYWFTVTADITVDGIGLFDFGSDGLSSPHQVALWNAIVTPSGDLVEQSFRIEPLNLSPPPPSNPEVSDSGFGSYIYLDLAAHEVLEPGDYVLGASYLPGSSNQDLVQAMPLSIFSTPNVIFREGVFGEADGLTVEFPDPSIFGQTYFGPALRISSTIPEPLTAALFIIGLVGMGCNMRQTSRLADSIPA